MFSVTSIFGVTAKGSSGVLDVICPACGVMRPMAIPQQANNTLKLTKPWCNDTVKQTLMKVNRSLFLLSLSGIIFGSSCSTVFTSEEPDPDIPSPDTLTINVRVNAGPMSRAADAEDIRTLYLAFYKNGSTPELLYIKTATPGGGADGGTYSVDLPKGGDELPDMVRAFANFESVESLRVALTGGTVNTLTSSGNLLYSHAAYYSGGNPVDYVVLDSGHLLNGHIVELCLERLAAKVSVSQKEGMTLTRPVLNNPDGTPVTLSLVLDGWVTSCTDKETNLLKKIPKESEVSSLLGAQSWTTDIYKTIHWAHSVNYGKFVDDAQIYRKSFGEISTTFNDQELVHETTRSSKDASVTDGRPCILLAGHYRSGSSDLPTFYVTVSEKGNVFFASEGDYLEHIASSVNFIYTKGVGESLNPISVSEFKNIIVLKTPLQNGSKVSDRYVSPHVKDEAAASCFKSDGTPYGAEELNRLLYMKFGTLEKFLDGKCVFVIPVEHAVNGTEHIYGLVRNHHYDLTINSVSGLGLGVGSLNEPVTEKEPTAAEKTYSVDATLKVTPWVIISSGVDVRGR